MPLSLFLSRWLSLYTGGLGPWDAAKDIFTLFLLLVSVYMAVRNGLIKDRFLKPIFILAALYGLLHAAFFLLNPDLDARSGLIAMTYNGRILAYLFIGYVTAKVLDKDMIQTALKVVLVISTITCVFALVQFVAPKDLMTHFGYSVERGAKPYFFIDDKPDLPRVMSTIRDPNSYGAYLIVPLTLLWLLVMGKYSDSRKLITGARIRWLQKTARARLFILALFGLHALTLLLTFSRGAWIGAFVSLFIATFLTYSSTLVALAKRNLPAIAIFLIVMSAGGLMFRNTYLFQNVLLHSDESTVLADPNELRVQLQASAAEAIIDKPLGHGPGTAGLASIGNPKGTLLTENYFLQIGYEVGIFGLMIFLAILGLVYLGLLNTKPSKVRLVLLSSFWGYVFISFLIHLWSNEAVALQWWMLSGIVIASYSHKGEVSWYTLLAKRKKLERGK